MGVEQRVSEFTPDNREKSENSSPLTFRELFYKCLPMYLAMGMTYEQYFNGSSDLVKYYREAEKIKTSRINQIAWLNGRYIYDALCCVAPMYAFKPTKPVLYPKYPYALDEQEKQEYKEIEKKNTQQQAIEYMNQWKARVNSKRKGGEMSE